MKKTLLSLTALVALVVATSSLAADAAKPSVVKHDLAGRDQCLMCHSGTMPNIPAGPADTHKGRENSSCLLCHSKDSPVQTANPTPIPHDLAGRDQCLMCHTGTMPNIKGAPASHKGYENKSCTLCHRPAAK